MRMGYNTNGAIGFPLEDTIRLLSDLGFQSIALTLDHEVLNPFSADIGQSLERTQRLLTRLGMHSVVETGARYLLNRQVKHHPTLVSPDPAEQQFRILFLKRAVEIASRLESDCVSLWSGPIPVDGLENRDQIWDRFCDRLSEVLDYAQRLDVPLGFEPEPGMLVATVADFLHLQKRLPHPMLRLTLDIGHVVCQAEGSVPDIVAQVAGDLVNVHLEDACAGRHEHLPLGEGEVNFPEVFASLRQANYQAGVHLELSRHSHAFPALAASALQFLKLLP